MALSSNGQDEWFFRQRRTRLWRAANKIIIKYYLYIIYSPAYDKHYIGISDDPKRRLIEHNLNKVKSTKAYTPYKLVWIETYTDKTTARKRELFLKRTAKEKHRIYQIIHNTIK